MDPQQLKHQLGSTELLHGGNTNNNKRKKRRRKCYKECMKNHAAALGGHAIDGCRQFIASPSCVASDPSSLTCAACSCHRNFHRPAYNDEEEDREEEEDSKDEEEEESEQNEQEEDEAAGSQVLLTLKTGPPVAAAPVRAAAVAVGAKKKRYRSKFSKEQKEGMMELAERVGWRLQRREEEVVEEGCRRIGVERGVFKVWMHNNKQGVMDMKKKKMMMIMMNNNNNHDHDPNDNNNNNTNNVVANGNGNGSSTSVSVSDHDGGVKTGSTSSPPPSQNN